MRKKLIMEAFDLLKSKGIVSSEAEFSEYWLAHSECYLRTLRMKRAEPSMGVVAICASRLMNAAEQLRNTPRYMPLSIKLAEMSNRCREVVDADSVKFDLMQQ